MFIGRVWPEGYEFPACDLCQSVSSKDEMLVALLSRMYPDQESAKGLAEFEKLLREVESNFRGIVASFHVSANKKRDWLEKLGKQPPAGMAAGEAPLISLADPRFEQAVTTFATKLFLALYYRHTGRIVPHDGGARFRWWTNAQDLSHLEAPEIKTLLRQFPEMKRAKTPLSDQFSYRFATPHDNPNLYAFLVTFNRAFVMLGAVVADLHGLAWEDKTITVKPYVRT